MARPLIVAVLLISVAAAASAQFSERAIDVTPRPGITQRFLFATPEHPRAIVLLYPGGNGQIGLGSDGHIGQGGNFLVRSRRMFFAAGYAFAVLDAPSDSADTYRTSAQSAIDTKAVIDRVRQTDVPIVLIGTSRGSISAANAAARLGNAIDGLVLTSSVTESFRGQDSVNSVNLARINVPVLVVTNREDRCRSSPPEGSVVLAQRFTTKGSAFVEVNSSDGAGDPCEAAAPHGYARNEQAAVDAITHWIDATLSRPGEDGRPAS